MADASGALDELRARLPARSPADNSLLGEVHRLAEATTAGTTRWSSRAIRFHRAPKSERKLAIAMRGGGLVEKKVQDPLRAFRAYLRAFQLAPVGIETIRDHLWRLARVIGVIDRGAESAFAAPPVGAR